MYIIFPQKSNFYFEILRTFKIFNNEMYKYTISVKNFKTPCLSCINYFLWKNYLCRRSNEEESLIKDKDIIFKRQQYLCFTELLTQNKAIKKGSGLKTTIKDIEKVTGMSKSTYY